MEEYLLQKGFKLADKSEYGSYFKNEYCHVSINPERVWIHDNIGWVDKEFEYSHATGFDALMWMIGVLNYFLLLAVQPAEIDSNK